METSIVNFLKYLQAYISNFIPATQTIGIFYQEDYDTISEQVINYNFSNYSIKRHRIDIMKLNYELVNLYDFSIFLFDVYQIYQNNQLKDYYNKVIPEFKNYIHKVMFIRDINNSFQEVFAIPPEQIINKNHQLINIANNAKSIEIVNSLGTNLTASISDSVWTDLNGVNHRANLVPSEISTSSPSLTGEIVFTGALQSQIPIGIKFGLITESDKIFFKIENSEIIELSSNNHDLEEELNKYLNFNPANRKVTELGIGTNTGIKKLVGKSAPFEERYPGFHLGIGGSTKGSQHMDFIFDECSILLDNSIIFKNHNFIN